MVYVDDMYKSTLGKFGRMKMSHMMADTEDELHAMAAKIGVARRWHQRNHYDVCMEKRSIAIAFGAQELSMRELCRKIIEQRKGGGA